MSTLELELEPIVELLSNPNMVKTIARNFVTSDESLSIIDEVLPNRADCSSDEEYFNEVLHVLGQCVFNEFLLISLKYTVDALGKDSESS